MKDQVDNLEKKDNDSGRSYVLAGQGRLSFVDSLRPSWSSTKLRKWISLFSFASITHLAIVLPASRP